MISHVIGFEGSVSDNALVGWGTAAIVTDGMLLNPATGRKSSRGVDGTQLAEQGHLTLLTKRIRLPDPPPRFDRSVVYAVRKSSDYRNLLWTGHRVAGRNYSSTGEEFEYHFFESFDQFHLFRRTLSSYLAWYVMFKLQRVDDALPLVRAGLTLSAKDPVLHALRVHFCPPDEQDAYQEIAETVIRDEEHLSVYRELLGACQRAGSYSIRYKHGIAEKGGLDIEDSLTILAAIRTAQQRLRPEVVARRPYLSYERDLPTHRFFNLEDQSATLAFTANVRESTLGERVARHVELKALEEAVAGRSPAALDGDKEFQEAMQTILNQPETEVYHHPMGGTEDRVYYQQQQPQAIVRRDHIKTFGLLCGILGKKIDVAIHAPMGRSSGRIAMYYTDDGEGGIPEGTDNLERDFLYRPCVVTVVRNIDATGRETHHLQAIEFPTPTRPIAASNFPCGSVPGAYVAEEHAVSIVGQTLDFGFGKIHGVDDYGKTRVTEWMMAFTAACLERELACGAQVRRVPVPHDPKLSSVNRLIVALHDLGDTALVSEVALRAAQIFGGEVISHSRYLLNETKEIFSVDDETLIVKFTSRGKKYSEALRLARGRRQAGVVPLPY